MALVFGVFHQNMTLDWENEVSNCAIAVVSSPKVTTTELAPLPLLRLPVWRSGLLGGGFKHLYVPSYSRQFVVAVTDLCRFSIPIISHDTWLQAPVKSQ